MTSLRVVVTGIGLVTPLGVGTEETWHALTEGRSAVDRIRTYDPSSLRTQIAAELDGFDPERFASRKALRSMTRNDQLAVAAAALAVEDAGVELEEIAEQAALFAGSSKEISRLEPILEGFLAARTPDGSADVRLLGERASSVLYPLFYVEGLQAASLFYISQSHGVKGANTYFAGTAEAGSNAIGRAFRAVKRGEAAVAVAGGFDDACSMWNMTKFDRLDILTDRNDLGAEACRPYDADRTGTVLGEGAAFLVLEEAERAAARGARVYAEVAGYGSGFDTSGLLAPDPEGRALASAIRAALREAGAAPGDVGYVAGEGSGAPDGDASEATAIRSVFDPQGKVLVSSVKAATGHLLGGAGALNAAVSALALHSAMIPPTLNLDQTDSAGGGIDWVAREARETRFGAAVALARGLEGQNIALVMRTAL